MSIRIVLPLFIDPEELEKEIGKDQLCAWKVVLVNGDYEKRKEMRNKEEAYYCFTPSIDLYDNFHKPTNYWSSVMDMLTEYNAIAIYEFNSKNIVSAFKEMMKNIINPVENKLEYNPTQKRYIIP